MKKITCLLASSLILSSCGTLFESSECKVAKQGLAEAKVKLKAVELENDKKARASDQHQYIPNDIDSIMDGINKVGERVDSASELMKATEGEFMAQSVVEEMCGTKAAN